MSDIENIHLLDLENYGSPPKATTHEPLLQISWLFDKRSDRENNVQTKKRYRYARNRTLKYIQSIHGSKPFILNKHVDEFFLVRLANVITAHQNIIEGGRKLASHTLVSYFSSVRQVIFDALNQGLLGCETIQEVSIGSSSRETDAHSDYSDNEISQILNAVSEEMRDVKRIMAGYVPLKPGQGRDPRINSKIRHANKDGYGWKVLDNLQWYFENEMQAVPIVGDAEKAKLHRAFLHHASFTHGGLFKNYHKWGVTHVITRDLIMPNVVNLIYLTGLNPTSLLELDLNCYQDEHPLTGMPYLSYEKKRSNGDKELHIPLLESREQITLKRKQANLIKKSIEIIQSLTESFRDAPKTLPALRNRLIIYQATNPGKYSESLSLSSAQTSSWCRQIVKKYDLKNDDGEPLEFNLVRFRSTKLTQMALEGRDIFEIQQAAGHANIVTTVSYLNRNRLDVIARKEVTDALQLIRENRVEVRSACQEDSSNSNDQYQPIKIFRGVISDCKNTYDPPENVKRLKDYVPGSACIRFNMCLFCHNVVIMKEHLPKLVSYRAQIMSLVSNNIQNLPNGDHYEKSLELLNQLLDHKVSDFSEEDIEWAVRESEALDVYVDPLIYHGVDRAA